MHRVNAARRRIAEKENSSPPKPRGTSRVSECEGRGIFPPGGGVFQYMYLWLKNPRAFASFCFIFGMTGRFFHFFDPLLQTDKGSFPAYLACPAVVLTLSILYTALAQHDTHGLPQIMTMVCCSGVLAGAIMEEQLEEVSGGRVEITTDDTMLLSFCCSVLSFLVYALDYHRGVQMRRVAACFVIVVLPTWAAVLYHLYPPSALLLQSLLFTAFTLAVGIVDFYGGEARAALPLLPSVFPPQYVGCLVQGAGMVALTTYYVSTRTNLFSPSWFSFAWLVFAGPPLVIFTGVCHLIHCTFERIFGPGPHNSTYLLRAVMGAWAAATAAHHYGVLPQPGVFWNSVLEGTEPYRSGYSL